jgi:hypothetical protein
VLLLLSLATMGQATQETVVCVCSSEPCLRFMGGDIALEGTLTTREGGAFMLNLDEAKCAIGTHAPKDQNDAYDVGPQTMLHVAFLEDDLLARGSKAVGHRVKLFGYVFPWETAWHLTPIMFGAKAMQVLN